MTLQALTTVAYGAGSLGFGVFAVLLLTAWRGRLQGMLMLVAVIATALWCAAVVAFGWTGRPPFVVLELLEVVRNLLWLVFLLRLLSPPEVTGSSGQQAGSEQRKRSAAGWLSPKHWMPWRWTVVTALWAAVLALVVATVASVLVDARTYGVADGALAQSKMSMTGFLLMAVCGLTLIDQLYRNSRREHRWSLKFLLLGLGTLFVYDLYLYSTGVLFGDLEPVVWAARGLVQVLVLPFLALAARRNPQWSLDVFISRQVAFHTAAFLGCGVYLVVMAAAGYWIRDFGGTWGAFAQALFMFGACIVLAVLFFSGQLRSKLRVFLVKHFYRNKYDYREEWLRFTRTLSAGDPSQPLIERIIDAVSAIVGSSGGVLFARASRADVYTAVAARGMPLPKRASEAKDGPLASFLVAEEWVVVLDRHEVDSLESRFGLVLPEWLDRLSEAWLVVPFMHADMLIAFLVVKRPPNVNAPKLNYEDLDLLKTAGSQSASYMALWRTTEALSEARQFEAFNRLSAYVVHDLKNVSGQLSLMLANARKHRDSPGFIDDALATVDNSVQRMNKMLAQLKTDISASTPLRPRSIKLEEVAGRATLARGGEKPVPSFHATDRDLWVRGDESRLHDVIEHLVRNAQDATPDDGEVQVRLSKLDGQALLEVRDTGSGMDEGFIAERLFRPFDTTKGNAGMGVGAHQARELVRSLGGRVWVNSEPGHGTAFFVELPLSDHGNDPDSRPGHYDREQEPGTSTADFMS